MASVNASRPLSGISERIALLGERLEAGPILTESVFGFRLQVELPSSLSEQQTDRTTLVHADQMVSEEASQA